MKIVDLSMVYDTRLTSREEQLRQHYTSVCWSEAMHRGGADVHSLRRFSGDGDTTINGVHYRFVRDRFGHHLRNYEFPWRLYRELRRLRPDVVQLHHLSLSIHNLFIRQILPSSTILVIQHHGGPINIHWKQRFHNQLNRVVDGFFFTTAEDGKSWLQRSSASEKIFELMEGSPIFNFDSRDQDLSFVCPDREAIKQRSGMKGNPVFLWNGRLDENKDPLTVLKGFEKITNEFPEAGLYMIFRETKLLEQVERQIKQSEQLSARVNLVGAVDRKELLAMYQRADYFVLGSHYEGTCYSLAEALRAGCIPIVSNIPSFRKMTDDGRLGALWNPGSADDFADKALSLLRQARPELHQACIHFFQQHLSYDAIAAKTLACYREMMKRKNQSTPGM